MSDPQEGFYSHKNVQLDDGTNVHYELRPGSDEYVEVYRDVPVGKVPKGVTLDPSQQKAHRESVTERVYPKSK